VGYTWLTNTFETVHVLHQSIVIAAMAAMLIAATTRKQSQLTGGSLKAQIPLRAKPRMSHAP
jgi:hypothetical protein